MLDQMSGGRLDARRRARHLADRDRAITASIPTIARRCISKRLAILRQALTSRKLTFHGKFYDYTDVPIELEPLQKPHPPLWAGASTPDGARGRRHQRLQFRRQRAHHAGPRPDRPLPRGAQGRASACDRHAAPRSRALRDPRRHRRGSIDRRAARLSALARAFPSSLSSARRGRGVWRPAAAFRSDQGWRPRHRRLARNRCAHDQRANADVRHQLFRRPVRLRRSHARPRFCARSICSCARSCRRCATSEPRARRGPCACHRSRPHRSDDWPQREAHARQLAARFARFRPVLKHE